MRFKFKGDGCVGCPFYRHITGFYNESIEQCSLSTAERKIKPVVLSYVQGVFAADNCPFLGNTVVEVSYEQNNR